MKGLWISLVILAIALTEGIAPSPAEATPSAGDGKNPSVTLTLDRLGVDDPATVRFELRAADAEELAGYGLVLHYDAARLTFQGARHSGEGLLPLVNGSTGLVVASNPSPGQVSVGVVKVDGSAGRGSGELMVFTFGADGPLVHGDIGISDAVLVDLSGHSDAAAGIEIGVANLTAGEYELAQNAPNPFNPETTLSYALPDPGHVRIVVYNALGQEVRVLVDGVMGSGAHSVVWDGRDGQGRQAASGVYLYRMVTQGFQQVRRMMLMK